MIIITGLSGSGKGRLRNVFSDYGYRVIDNMPVGLFAEVGDQNTVLTADIRNAEGGVDQLLALGADIVYSDASDEYIIRRYKETRRTHPLAKRFLDLEGCIAFERELFLPLYERAKLVIANTNMSYNQVTELIGAAFLKEKDLITEIRSFGFMRGIPSECDLVFDARFLPNPFYDPELRPLTGRDQKLYDYVMGFPDAREYGDKIIDTIKFLIPRYKAEGRGKITVGIGCTGGRHRSVSLARYVGGQIAGSTVTHYALDAKKG